MLQISRSNVENQTRKTEENIRDTIDQCTQLESRLEAESGKYVYLQELKGYIADLCDMLQVLLCPPSFPALSLGPHAPLQTPLWYLRRSILGHYSLACPPVPSKHVSKAALLHALSLQQVTARLINAIM